MAVSRIGTGLRRSTTKRRSSALDLPSQKAPGSAGRALKEVPAEADRARSSRAFSRLARAGIGARAVIYSLLAFMTADIALTRHSPASPSGTGALSEVAKQPAGRPLLVLLGVGLAGYAAWRLLQVVSHGETHGEKRPASVLQRAGWAAIACLYLLLCWRAAELAVNPGFGAGGGASQQPQPFVAMVLRWPGGPGWVGLAGAGVAVGGICLVVWGCVHDYSKTLDTRRLGRLSYRIARATGMAGEAVRGALVALVAVYLLQAAVKDDPSRAKSLGGALYSFDRLVMGPALLLVATLGLVCFVAYSLFEAKYRRI
jgi:Domain of Unknown Function (DUF1206)